MTINRRTILQGLAAALLAPFVAKVKGAPVVTEIQHEGGRITPTVLVDGVNGFDISSLDRGYSVRDGKVFGHNDTTDFGHIDRKGPTWCPVMGKTMGYVDISGHRYFRGANNLEGDWFFEGSNDRKIWTRLEPRER